MEYGLAIASTLPHDLRRRAKDLLQVIEQAKARGGPCGDSRSTLDERLGLLERQIPLQNPEVSGPPCRACIDIRAVLQQHVDEGQILFCLMDCGRVEIEARLVDASPHLCM